MSMSYHVKLQHFEGPMDLLLHLITKSKVQIEDISIAEITEQYLETLQYMEQFDIDIASEFLVTAATLLHIKSCTLLPKDNQGMEEMKDDFDPREELIAQLLEYKKYKEVSNQLKEREAYFSRMFYKLPEENIAIEDQIVFPAADTALLQGALFQLINARKNNPHTKIVAIHKIKRDSVTVNERMIYLKKYFSNYNQSTFFQLFQESHDRENIIVTFLALLELLKDNFVDVHQNLPFGDIVIKRRGLNG